MTLRDTRNYGVPRVTLWVAFTFRYIVNRGNELLNRGNELLNRGNELLNRGNELLN